MFLKAPLLVVIQIRFQYSICAISSLVNYGIYYLIGAVLIQ